MRETIGRLLCAGLGALYMAGAMPLFNYGAFGREFWPIIESYIAVLADSIGISTWFAMLLLSPFAIGGPMALVWIFAGRGINRTYWFLAGILGYGAFYLFF